MSNANISGNVHVSVKIEKSFFKWWISVQAGRVHWGCWEDFCLVK